MQEKLREIVDEMMLWLDDNIKDMRGYVKYEARCKRDHLITLMKVVHDFMVTIENADDEWTSHGASSYVFWGEYLSLFTLYRPSTLRLICSQAKRLHDHDPCGFTQNVYDILLYTKKELPYRV
jgi:hypothetical protein